MSRLGGRLALLALWLALALVLLDRLGADPWYDEAYTLLAYVHTGPLYALTHYTVPNNHILYSALLGLLPAGSDLLYRMPSLLFAVLTVIVTARVARRLAGPGPPAWAIDVTVVGLFFASPGFLTLAPAIRGYGLSMLLASVGLALVVSAAPLPPLKALVYALLGAIALGVVPTNLAYLGALAVVHLGLWWRRPCAERGSIVSLVAPHALAVVAGSLVYLPVLHDLLSNLGRGWGEPAVLAIGRALAAGLLPGPVLLVLLARRRSEAGQPTESAAEVRRWLVVAGAVGATILIVIGARLYARGLSPFLPMVIALTAAWATPRLVGDEARLVRAALLVALLGQLYWQASVRLLHRDDLDDRARALLPPYHAARAFDPWATVRAVEPLLRADPEALVLVDGRLYAPPPAPPFSDPFALYYQLVKAGLDERYREIGPGAEIDRDELAAAKLVVIARDRRGLDAVCARVGRSPRGAQQVVGDGFYRVWRWR